MKNPKAMTYSELEQELRINRKTLATATLEQKRTLIRRDHDLMMEMDRRWNAKEGK